MSNSLLYYFSATGNSLSIANGIANKLGNTKIIPMLQYDKNSSMREVTIVGLVFPVYGFGVPLVVKRFIENLNIPENIYVFSLATNGGLPMATLRQTSKLFSKKGISFQLFGTTSLVPIDFKFQNAIFLCLLPVMLYIM